MTDEWSAYWAGRVVEGATVCYNSQGEPAVIYVPEAQADLIEQLAEAVSALLNEEPEESHPLGVEAIAAYRRWRGRD